MEYSCRWNQLIFWEFAQNYNFWETQYFNDNKIRYLWCVLVYNFKGQCHALNPSGLLIQMLEHFQIWFLFLLFIKPKQAQDMETPPATRTRSTFSMCRVGFPKYFYKHRFTLRTISFLQSTHSVTTWSDANTNIR